MVVLIILRFIFFFLIAMNEQIKKKESSHMHNPTNVPVLVSEEVQSSCCMVQVDYSSLTEMQRIRTSHQHPHWYFGVSK